MFLVGTVATKSPFCMVVVLKNWDLVRPPPPPSLGQNPNFGRKFVLQAPLIISSYHINLMERTAVQWTPFLTVQYQPFLNLSTGDLGNVESWPGRHLSAKTQFQIPMLDTSHRLCCVQIFYVGVLHIFKICSWSVINHVMFDIERYTRETKTFNKYGPFLGLWMLCTETPWWVWEILFVIINFWFF